MKKGTLKFVMGDVTEPQLSAPNEVPIIPHCCNNLGVMGAGVALALKNKWPMIEVYYKRGSMSLGSVSSWMEFTDEFEPPKRTPVVGVFNMVGQDGVVSPDNTKPVRYSALADAMNDILNKVDSLSLSFPQKKFVFHCPKFGSDLAGGNWDLILELIEEIWINNGFDVVVYEYGDPIKIAQDIEDERIKFHNYYHCLDCDTEWEDDWSCTCNDKCPDCNKEIEPYKSEDIPKEE
jgi:O-acetyl-ADP-ribose deacetylase (regulator of RNase III)